MGNGAVVTAIAGEDLAGLTMAYDRYAASLYDYCMWIGPDPALAADALREVFAAVAPSAAPGLPFAGELRSRLYAAARNACGRPASATEARPDGVAGQETASAELAEARRLARAVLADLDPLEQEVVELRFRHRLTAIETADVLGVLPSQVPDLTESARRYLEEVLGALVVVRAGAPSCPRLAALLHGRDEPLTTSTGKLAARHIGHCRECARHRPGELRPDQLPGLLPLAEPPDGLRELILSRPPAGQGAAGQGGGQEGAGQEGAVQHQLATWDGSARPSGPAQAGAFLRRDGIWARPAAATAVAAVMVCIAAAVTAIVMTASGTHAHALAAHQISVQAAASGSPSGGAPATTRAPHSSSPGPVHRSASAVAAPAVPVAPAMGVAGPAPASRTTSAASVSPSASKTASPSPRPTHHGTPSPKPTDSGSSSPSGSPSPSPSASRS